MKDRNFRPDYQRLLNVVGHTIKERRNEHCVTQSELASDIGISKSFLSDIEHSRVLPSLETYLKLCEALKLDLTFIEKK